MILRGHIEKYAASQPNREVLEHIDIYDLQMHIILFQLDLAIASKHFLVSYGLNDEDEVNYFARAISVHLTDILNKKDGAKKRIDLILEKRCHDQKHKELILELSALNRAIKKIGVIHFDKIKEIRNNLFAHKTGKGIDQNLEMQKIDVMKLIYIGSDIHNTLSEIGRLMCDFFIDGIKTVKPDDEATSIKLQKLGL